MSKYFIYILISTLLLFGVHGVFSQSSFNSMLDKDSLYRYNTSLKSLDSLLSSEKESEDTSFYKSYGKAEVINLDELIYFALNNNPDLKTMQYNIESQDKLAQSKTYLPDPMFDFELDNIMSNLKQVGMINFFASQMFPFPGKLSLKRQEVLNNSDMLSEERRDMSINIINLIKNNFYDLFLVDRKLDINHENQLIINNFITASESRYAVGKGMQQEVFKAQIELSKLLNEEFVLKQDRGDIFSNLTKITKVVINDNTKVNYSGIDTSYLLNQNNFKFGTNDVDRLVDYAFHNRADLKALNSKIAMEQTRLDIAKLSRMPDLSLRLGYKILPLEPHNAFEFMVGVNVPIAPWSSGKYDYDIEKNTVDIKSSQEEYDSRRTLVRNEVKNTLNTIQSSKETMQYYYSVVIPQTENSLKATQSSYENGMTSFLDLLDSYRTYEDARLMFYESMNVYLKMIAKLEYITGMNFKN
jgi:cobalt-zinc-cadmium efflux system outer membrane protein